MRIGVVADNVLPEAGGVSTFVTTVVNAIRECSSNHEFVVWNPAVEPNIKWRWREAVKRGADIVGAGGLIRSTAHLIKSAEAAFFTR